MSSRLKNLYKDPLWIVGAAAAGLLVAIAIAGLIGLGINERVKSVTDQALKYDVELEDRGDDLRVAVLDTRHYHRNLVFAGLSRRGLDDFDTAYGHLHTAVDELDPLTITAPEVVQPDRLRQIAELYYTDFRAATDIYQSDRQAFTRVSDDGLRHLSTTRVHRLGCHVGCQ